jgi:hypothetical protein
LPPRMPLSSWGETRTPDPGIMRNGRKAAQEIS